jgi:hypothetical protein
VVLPILTLGARQHESRTRLLGIARLGDPKVAAPKTSAGEHGFKTLLGGMETNGGN